MTAQEYLDTAAPFKFKDFFIHAMGDMSYREASKEFGISTIVICRARSAEPYFPCLATVKAVAKGSGVDPLRLWLRVCEELFHECDDYKLMRKMSPQARWENNSKRRTYSSDFAL